MISMIVNAPIFGVRAVNSAKTMPLTRIESMKPAYMAAGMNPSIPNANTMTNIKAVKTPMLMKSRVLRREDVRVDVVFPFMCLYVLCLDELPSGCVDALLPEIAVLTWLVDQLIVRPALGDTPTVGEHNDLVSLANGFQFVGDDNQCGVFA